MLKNFRSSLSRIVVVFLIAGFTLSCEDNELSELLAEEVGGTVDTPIETDDEDDDTSSNNTTVVTYQNTVKLILDNACVECHNATNAAGGVRLQDFENAAAEAASGSMINRMTSTTSPMPPSGNLPDALIQDIMDWIDDGLLEN